MASETEVKVLEIDVEKTKQRLDSLGAKKLLEARLVVDWFRPEGQQEGEELWYLRIRKRSDGVAEVTWKGRSKVLGVSRTHEEIHFETGSHEAISALFQGVGLEKYAHQEKDRISFGLGKWRFDIDQYPNMPAYMEIESDSDESIEEAITTLGLGEYETSSDGERNLIQSKYGLDWYNMEF